MGIGSKEISEMVVRYYFLDQLLQGQDIEKSDSFQRHYNERLYLECRLRDVVLTGSEIVEKGIVEKIREDLELSQSPEKLELDKLEKDAKYVRVYRKAIRRLDRRYRRLRLLHKGLKESYEKLENSPTYEGEIEEINSIISGKQGSIIDEIRSVVESVVKDNT